MINKHSFSQSVMYKFPSFILVAMITETEMKPNRFEKFYDYFSNFFPNGSRKLRSKSANSTQSKPQPAENSIKSSSFSGSSSQNSPQRHINPLNTGIIRRNIAYRSNISPTEVKPRTINTVPLYFSTSSKQVEETTAVPNQPPSSDLCCDKCDGKHLTDDCPYYKKKREDHRDAQKGSKHLGATSLLPGAFISAHNAQVIRQPGDGSCLFHSIAYGVRERGGADHLRMEICRFISRNPTFQICDTPLCDWVKWDSGVDCATYARRMSGGAWGGGIEMAVAAHLKGINLHVYEQTSGGFKRISAFDAPADPMSKRTVAVLYRGGVHYGA